MRSVITHRQRIGEAIEVPYRHNHHHHHDTDTLSCGCNSASLPSPVSRWPRLTCTVRAPAQSATQHTHKIGSCCAGTRRAKMPPGGKAWAQSPVRPGCLISRARSHPDESAVACLVARATSGTQQVPVQRALGDIRVWLHSCPKCPEKLPPHGI
jgi:hypothetical protein